MAASSTATSVTPASLERAFLEFNAWAARLDERDEALRAAVQRLQQDLARTHSRLHEEVRLRAQSEARIGAMLALAPFGLVMVEDGRVAAFNAEAARLAPWLREGEPWSLPADWVRRGDSAVYDCGRGPRARCVAAQPLAADATRRLVRLEDVTDDVRARERSEREQRLAAMGRMAAELAHQLRTPLCVATLYADELLSSAGDDDARDTAGRLIEQLAQLERLITRMLGFVRNGARAHEVAAVEPLLREQAEVVAPLFERRGVGMAVSLEAPDCLLHADRLQIGTAVLALLENALQHSPSGSTVTLSCASRGHRVEVSVADEGPEGAQVAEWLFEPFASGRPGGTGLGLAIARAAADAHGGELSARPREPRGAVFTLALPALPQV